MSAKEDLRSLVNDLTDEEAELWLARMRTTSRAPDRMFSRALRQPAIAHRTDPHGVQSLIQRWGTAGPGMTEQEWDSFSRCVDKHRRQRPLFE